MSKIYHGTSELQRGWDRYFEQCNLFEVELTGGERDPSTKTLNRWRVDSPRGFCFVTHALPALGEELASAHEQDREPGKGFEEAWDASVEVAHAVAAKAILVKTPMEFSPGDTSRAMIEDLGKRAGAIKQAVIWESEGIWQPTIDRDWASERGVVMAFDPFMAIQDGAEAGVGDACFIINERAAMRRKFDQYDFEDLIDWGGSYQRIFILLRGRFGHEHARELRYVLENMER